MADPRDTPAMQQYYRFKKRHPDCILLFRIGDFYEMFDDDAVTASKAIGLTLTQRSEGVPMAGLPYHQLEPYLRKFIRAGFRVAVCEQLEDASKAKGIVDRGVTRVLTPGTLVDETLLDAERVSTLAAVVFNESGDDSAASVAIVDVATGSFIVADCRAATLIDELARRSVRELLFAATGDGKTPPRVQRLLDSLQIAGTPRPAWHFRLDESREAMQEQFGVSTLAGFGLADDEAVVCAAGALIRYLKETQTPAEEQGNAKQPAIGATASIPGRLAATLKHLRPPRREDPTSCCVVDAVSLRSLEVERTIRASGAVVSKGSVSDGSLLGILLGGNGQKSCCRTGMGKRMLREWLVRPSAEIKTIVARQDVVAALVEDRVLSAKLGELLDQVQDVARIGGRIALGRATPRDLVGLAKSIGLVRELVDATEGSKSLAPHRQRLLSQRNRLLPLAESVLKACVESPPPHLREGGLIKDGVDAELDEARLLQKDAGAWLTQYQTRLIAQHTLPSLKVGFNKIFGYYIELPTAQARNAPAELVRKQTLKNAERFTTPELREFEGKVMTAESRALERERDLFATMCSLASAILDSIALFGECVAEIDALLAFAEKAQRRSWVRPEIVEEPVLTIHAGRHPVLDELLGSGFVPNDIELGGEKSDRATERQSDSENRENPSAPSLALITGPNMAGKSTFIRQTALISLLAHTGSFVPADRATIGLIDRIFTRIGADDALHAGQSTFMVEMIETANILNHATPRSLVVLDEIGRGTSTLDGLSLAWAIAEHLAGESDVVTRKRSDEDAKKKGGRVAESQSSNETSDSHSVTSSLPHSVSPSLPPPGPRSLFATHYHEITELEERLPGRVKNLHVAVREWPPGDPHAQIVFLHRILPGRTDQSYGVHVARLAGIPAPVVARAREVLSSLAVHHGPQTGTPTINGGAGKSSAKPDVSAIPQRRREEPAQLGLFTEFIPHPAVDAIKELKLDSMSPMQAFDALRRVHGMVNSTAEPS